MPFGALERILRPDRIRQRAARRGGFSTPGVVLHAVGAEAMPLVASNARGGFVPTRPNRDGLAAMGFSEVPVGQEAPFLNELHRVLWTLSVSQGWTNRCSTVADGVDRLRSFGVEPTSLVLSERLLSSFLDGDIGAARTAMSVMGYVTIVDGIQVLLSDLPEGSALIAGPPASVGVYVRAGNHVGVLLQRVNLSLVLVDHVAG